MARKSKTKKTKPWSASWAVPAALLVIGAATLWVLPKTKEAMVNTNTVSDSTAPTLSIPTSDGITLAAEFTKPSGNGPWPVVILIHDFAADHHQWDPYITDFTSKGIAVLAYDMRGFGGSKLPAIPSDQGTWMNSLPNDIPAMISYVKKQSSIDPQHISIVGAGLGARVAYVASGSNLGIYRSVLLTPQVSPGVLDGSGISNFSPQNVLGIAGTTEKPGLDATMEKIHGNGERYDVDGGSLGVSLLSNKTTIEHVLDWLRS